MEASLLVIEGIDGSGKSTQVKIIKEYLEKKKLRSEFFHFPMYGHNQFSELIAQFLRGEFGNIDEIDPYFVATLYANDQKKFLPELEKSAEENDVIILDRYVFSNMAFQGAKFTDIKKAERMADWVFEYQFKHLEMPYPDLTIFLDVPPKITQERLAEERTENREYLKGKADIHESDMAYQRRVRDIYTMIKRKSIRYFAIDAAVLVPSDEGEKYHVYEPDVLFENYRNLVDEYVINAPASFQHATKF